MAILPTITVQQSLSPRKETKPEGRPAHHCDNTQTLFRNPWDSWPKGLVVGSMAAGYQAYKEWESNPVPPKEEFVKVAKPDWGTTTNLETWANEIKATWLGHACLLVELPAPSDSQPDKELATPARGPRILFDPVFSHRCSPFKFLGPARYTPPPMPLKELPHVDIVILSHNHYDHTDTATLKHIYASQPKGSVHFFCALGNLKWFESNGFSAEHVTELDWWDARDTTITLPNESTKSTLTVTCLPAQHGSGRTPFDAMKTLWASWAIEQRPYSDAASSYKPVALEEPMSKVWFGGDTALRHVPRGRKREDMPECPVFKEIGERFKGFDLAFVPIGAYSPRSILSAVHADPDDAVEIHLQIQSRRSIGMHWGCWILSDEPFMQDPKRLRQACIDRGVEPQTFDTLYVGETFRQSVSGTGMSVGEEATTSKET